MLSKIKLSMRITHSSLDTDIQKDINSAIKDMIRVGIQPYQKEDGEYMLDANDNKIVKDDELIEKACELYCKWQCDYLGKGDRFERNYVCLRDSLSMAGEYCV